MILWLDEQLSPYLAPWITSEFDLDCASVVDLAVDRGSDLSIFIAARETGSVVVTKDSDFLDLARRLGSPPQILWLSFGNRSNAAIKEILKARLKVALDLIKSGEPVVEIS